MKKIIDTIIIGGGIAGLSCARKLTDNQKDFLVITENLGGRIMTSSDGFVNYGAYYVPEHYQHLKKYVWLKKAKFKKSVLFHEKDQVFQKISWKLMINSVQAIKFYVLLKKFGRHYRKFKKLAEHSSQKEIIENDEFL